MKNYRIVAHNAPRQGSFVFSENAIHYGGMEQQPNNEVLRTLAYFDAFSRPLTLLELKKWCWGEGVPTHAGGEEKNGYYFLPGREGIVTTHQERVKLVEKKLMIAKQAGNWLRWVPFIRAVFVCNTVAMGSPKPQSDVDVFIVVKHGRIWTARLLATVILFLTGLRRGKRTVTDKVCLSFYHTDQSLDLSGIRLFPDDIYLAYWLIQLIPLYDPQDFLTRIQKANAWVQEYVPNGFQPYRLIRRHRVEDGVLVRVVRGIFEILLSTFFEQLFRKVQRFKMKQNTNSVQNAPDTRVVISDVMLKFHENDRREYYRRLWQETCRK